MAEYVTCQVCKKRYASKVPKMGDGSALMPRKHYTIIPAMTSLGLTAKKGMPIVCPGSYLLCEEDEPFSPGDWMEREDSDGR